MSRCNNVSSGARVLRDRVNRVCDTAATVYRWERGSWHFGRKLDNGDGGERLRGAGSGAPLCMWRRHVTVYGVTRPRCLALEWATLCVGAPTRISWDLAWFRIPR
jgi:hypothetical protein